VCYAAELSGLTRKLLIVQLEFIVSNSIHNH